MPTDPALEPQFHESHLHRWSNWHQNFELTVSSLLDIGNGQPLQSTLAGYKATTEGLQGLIAEALANGEELRGLGGGWSFSRVAATRGVLLNSKPLNYRFSLTDATVHDDYPGSADDLLFVQCGISIAEINRHLFAKDKSLQTSGASNGQTIAGATSTGTHGSAIDVGSLQDGAVAIHLVTGPDRHVWLERETHPTVADSLVAEIGAELIRDDAIFEAALVSFGSFGIIHGIVLEIENIFFLSNYRKKMASNAELRGALGSLDFSQIELPQDPERPYHFQVVINPFEPADDWFVTTMYKAPIRDPNLPLPDLGGGIKPGDDAMAVIAFLTDRFGVLAPLLVGGLGSIGYKEIDGECGALGQIFSDTSLRGRVASTALGVPLERTVEALDAIFELHQSSQAPILLSLRYVKATRATLGFTRHQERTCVFEIDGPRSQRVVTFYRQAWQRLEDLGIPYTFHWGKMNFFLTPERVRAAYGDANVDAWLAARHQLLPSAGLKRTFANDFLRGLDLAD